jgi:YesN/AraC family two-component response regulator
MINQSNIIRVLIADDRYIVRQGLVALLDRESDVKVVAQASNGQEAVTMFRQHQPDVTLMDLRMPVMDGVAAIAAIYGEFPSARIVVLTTYDGMKTSIADCKRVLRAICLRMRRGAFSSNSGCF